METRRGQKLSTNPPPQNDLGREGHLWDLVFKKLCGCKVSSSLIRRMAKKYCIDCPLSLSKNCVKERRDDAWKKYAKLKPSARKLRDEWLDRLADIIASTEGEEKARVIRILKS